MVHCPHTRPVSLAHGALRFAPIPHVLRPLAGAALLAVLAAPAVPAWGQGVGAGAPGAVRTALLPQVDVVDEAERSPGTSTVVSGEALEQAGSMKDVVRNQPLVSAPGTAAGTTRNRSSFDRSGTTGYNIRGIEGNRVGMDVDGVEMPDATTRPYVSRVGANTFGIGRDFIDPEMFSSVNILSGTTSARRSAGGIGGAVSFKTKSASDYLRGERTSYLGAKIGYDSADRAWNESFTGAARSGDLDGLISYSRRDGHAARNHSDVVNSYPDDWHSDALLLKGGLRVDGSNRLELSADLYRRKNDTFFHGWNTTNTAITEQSRQASDTERNTLQLTHQWTPRNAWVDHADTRLYFQDTGTTDVTDTTTLATGALVRNLSENQTRTWGASTTADKRIGRHQLSFGANASTQDVDRPWNVAGYMKPQPDTTTRRLGAFLQDDIAFDAGGKRLAVIPALRVDRIDIQTRNFGNFVSGVLTEQDVRRLYGNAPSTTLWSPSLGLTYDLAPRFITYAQYKRSGRAPSPGEIFGSWNMASNYATGNQYALIGNRDLKEESSNAFEVGVKGSPADGVTLNSSVFYTRYRDFIAYTRYTRASAPSLFTNVPAHIGTIYQAENRDEATIYGFELSARLEHGQLSPAARGLYTTWAVGLSKGTSRSHYAGDKDVALDSVLPRKAIVGVGYDAPMKQWGVNFTGTFVAAKQAEATNRDSYTNAGAALTDATTQLFRVPGYSVFDLSGYWQVNKSVRLQAGIYNLTDKHYWDYASARSLQPSVARDQRDIELLTHAGRTVAVSMSVAF
ncbi:TonB-dependent hemoglobin/transferrin/lactoferrin family receptor [Acidovorax sp. SUPP2522]|uniref:TonB-dependent hemoglobin/transferrin/lactoferrin family receptor n=1 Tax=Acidovorax sp. GBBC 1281 TaxID=2940492 RepID=UPI00234B62EA|nr:TonB-dependent hemoglobin/transferrin/lactoferrin family receptor [Acidovorax sp. GBBC 1281]WCM98164.1 TonB-dependent hemoglobin/transferrin/lactoferrin family receptor [Acidovorax sp. GBBC 1281]GKT18172.1 TonB-dependent hemoglobin/transferrin/lactoferrin family receptor [Acidovorax sp. SUPP2522]